MASLQALPPLDRMYLLSTCVGLVVYGINAVMFFGVVYVLAMSRKSRRRGVSSHRYLLATSTFLFVLVTCYAALTVQQLLEAFVTGPLVGTPHGATLYFVPEGSKIEFSKGMLYTGAVVIQDLVLVWRLWAVFGRDWRVIILPLIVEGVHISAATIAITLVFQGAPIGAESIKSWGLVGWALDMSMSLGLSGTIALRLWWAGRATADIRTKKNNAYLGAMLVVLESGGLFASSTFILFVCYLVPSTQVLGLVGLSVICQMAALSPMLIIVRVGLGLTYVNVATTYNNPHSSLHFATGRTSTLQVSVPISTSDNTAVESDKGSFAMKPVGPTESV